MTEQLTRLTDRCCRVKRIKSHNSNKCGDAPQLFLLAAMPTCIYIECQMSVKSSKKRESADARGRKGRARQKKLRHHEQLLLQCRNNGWVVMHEADLTKGRCGGAADTPRLFGSDLHQVRHRYYIVHDVSLIMYCM